MSSESGLAAFLHSRRFFEAALYLCIALLITLIVINAEKTSLDRIRNKNELIVITRNTPTTYYEGLDGKTGFEYDLVKLFADHLGVKLTILVPDTFNDIIPLLIGGEADIAAAGLTITDARKQLVRFSPSYQEITQQLIYKRIDKNSRPKSIEDIIGKQIEVVAGSSFEERLLELKKEYPELTWVANEQFDSDQLIEAVAAGDIDYTIIDSNEFELSRRFYPSLRSAFAISEPQQLAWAMSNAPERNDLYAETQAFFSKIQDDGTLTRLLERHYAHARGFKPVETTVFLRHVNNRLNEYKSMFIEASERHQFDWRLLAAMSYQESHWITNAVSPTGVRGIMMLTQRTAGQLEVRNRLDARESIMGGAKYLRIIKDNLPEHITEPDRTWMAVASYNVGSGHLEDARKITQSQGGDPNKWGDVKTHLPLLSQKKWYKKTKYGYARGREPVVYVRNIRSYYDILVWLSNREQQAKKLPEPQVDTQNFAPQSL